MENKPRIPIKTVVIVGVALLLLIIFLAFTLMPEKESRFTLESVTPASGSEINPDKTTIMFKFNRPLSLLQNQKGLVMEVTPRIEAVYGVVGDTLNINLSDLLLTDNTDYTLTLKHITSRSNEVIGEVVSTIKVKFTDGELEVINGLPYKGNGFGVAKLSDYTLHVLVNKKPFNNFSDAALDYLDKRGIDSTKFDIAIDSTYDRSEQGDDGIRHAD